MPGDACQAWVNRRRPGRSLRKNDPDIERDTEIRADGLFTSVRCARASSPGQACTMIGHLPITPVAAAAWFLLRAAVA